MKRQIQATAITLAIALSACSQNKSTSTQQAPVVVGMQQSTLAAPHVASQPVGTNPNAPQVITQIQLSKSLLLNRTFLYGSSLQFSSMSDPSMGTGLMALAIGENPATFRIVDDKLQLLADQSITVESDVDHPARLIHEFQIVRQDASSVTIRAAEASPILATVLFDNKVAANRSSWIRSLQYIPDTNLLMWESSIEAADGTIGEFMETLMPRDSLVPADYKPMLADPSLEPAAARYRFLSPGAVFLDAGDGTRVQTQLAERWNLTKGGVIQWWVTQNAPDQYLPDIKNAVEAWNRYSQAMWKRDFIHFNGKLPDNVKVGDPRYNVIVWDTVQDAGAAYESQGADPTSGIQTHSMIYMPLAWVNIGKEYWDSTSFSEGGTSLKIAKKTKYMKSLSFLGRSLPINCIQDPTENLTLGSRTDSETFARDLLKGVIFHEVGHSFGLAHNFKGSLSFDPDDPKSAFSTSIMDYNEYDEEAAGDFYSLDTSKGPLLEYDRQIISVLYNDAKDVKSTDPVLPACADDEADSKAGGVDPLCVRYDIGKDPSKETLRAIDLVQNEQAKNGLMSSLYTALAGVGKSLPDASTIKTMDDASAAVTALYLAVKGTANIYMGGGANSLAYMAAEDVRNLYVFQKGSLPDSSYNEADMRARAVQAVNYVANTQKLPDDIAAEVSAIAATAQSWLAATPAYQGLKPADQTTANQNLLKPLSGLNDELNVSLLSKMRTRVMSALTYSATAPFYLHVDASGTQDMEAYAVSTLLQALTTQSAGKDRPAAERLAEAQALATFSPTAEGTAAIKTATDELNSEIKNATDGTVRAKLRIVLSGLTPAASDASSN